ncbi:hypothetical protein BCR33DRAFT_583581 [Rhizoclosmatium globosum]|uniref:Uncharacterized protein n=1 Tax=Rhizoclosmatium globosum TaxID=329046 RepID=A0A1Y2CRL4_9FUNG|nr:hypothetical protein BCR33DRAFT_583581 [Rhizoclosmatium globosum]|eukprot:ORY49484.1 hypothetical protein BCR33DRAFT_583581 [Rhizoclosmatium globosum]
MNRTLAPGGCLNIAYGTVDAAAGPMNFTIATTPQVLPASSVKDDGTLVFGYPFGESFTLVHIWDNSPIFMDTQQMLFSSCTIPAYNTSADAVFASVVDQERWPEYVIAQPDKTFLYSSEFSYTVGCPYPNGTKNGALNFHVQVWGQSHVKKVKDSWSQLPKPGLLFSGAGLKVDVDSKGVASVVGAGWDKSRVGKAEKCPFKISPAPTESKPITGTTTSGASRVWGCNGFVLLLALII